MNIARLVYRSLSKKHVLDRFDVCLLINPKISSKKNIIERYNTLSWAFKLFVVAEKCGTDTAHYFGKVSTNLVEHKEQIGAAIILGHLQKTAVIRNDKIVRMVLEK